MPNNRINKVIPSAIAKSFANQRRAWWKKWRWLVVMLAVVNVVVIEAIALYSTLSVQQPGQVAVVRQSSIPTYLSLGLLILIAIMGMVLTILLLKLGKSYRVPQELHDQTTNEEIHNSFKAIYIYDIVIVIAVFICSLLIPAFIHGVLLNKHIQALLVPDLISKLVIALVSLIPFTEFIRLMVSRYRDLGVANMFFFIIPYNYITNTIGNFLSEVFTLAHDEGLYMPAVRVVIAAVFYGILTYILYSINRKPPRVDHWRPAKPQLELESKPEPKVVVRTKHLE